MHTVVEPRSWVIQLLFSTTTIIQLSLITTGEAYIHKSAPGCPQESSNGVWLLDWNNICHKVNSQGPCGDNMLFFPHPSRSDKIHGFCECFDARMETEEEIDFITNRELTGCLNDVRSQIFVPERNRCYSAFDQGPCPDGKWLVLNDTYYPICSKNPCSSRGRNSESDPLSVRFQFTHGTNDNKCYKTMSRGYCPKSYRLRFSPNDWIPKCRYTVQPKKLCPEPKPFSEGMVLRSRCKPGSRRDYLSKCTQSVNPR